MSQLLAGKVCLVAGTTGIGAATAQLFASHGAKIFAVGRSKENAAALEERIQRAGGQCRTLARDLSESGAAELAVATALNYFGRLDVLFHVAGISGRKFGDGPLADCTDDGWDAVMNTNLRAMFRMNRACLHHWLDDHKSGVILNMASVLGFSYSPELFQTVAYASTKAAIIAMSQHAAATYAKNHIRVNVIAPGLVETPMAQRATENPAILDYIKHKQPLTGAPLKASDCAQAALYLCSDMSAAVTGIVMPVDAGWCVSN